MLKVSVLFLKKFQVTLTFLVPRLKTVHRNTASSPLRNVTLDGAGRKSGLGVYSAPEREIEMGLETSGNFGHRVNSDIHLQTVEQWIFTVFFVSIFYSNN